MSLNNSSFSASLQANTAEEIAETLAIRDKNTAFLQLPNVLIDEHLPAIRAYGMAIYATIASHKKHAKSALFPSLKRLGALAGLEEHAIMRHVRKLEESKALHCERRRLANGRYAAMRYTLPLMAQKKAPWFWINTAIVEDYGAIIGPHALALYCLLARYTENETQTVKRSLLQLAKALKTDKKAITEYRAILEEHHLISCDKNKRENGKNETTIYTLLRVEKQGSMGVTEFNGMGVTEFNGMGVTEFNGMGVTEFIEVDFNPLNKTGNLNTHPYPSHTQGEASFSGDESSMCVENPHGSVGEEKPCAMENRSTPDTGIDLSDDWLTDLDESSPSQTGAPSDPNNFEVARTVEEEAVMVLGYLNSHTGHGDKDRWGNIKQRLRDGYTSDECRAIINWACKDTTPTPHGKRAAYLRNSRVSAPRPGEPDRTISRVNADTLFSAEHFAEYLQFSREWSQSTNDSASRTTHQASPIDAWSADDILRYTARHLVRNGSPYPRTAGGMVHAGTIVSDYSARDEYDPDDEEEVDEF